MNVDYDSINISSIESLTYPELLALARHAAIELNEMEEITKWVDKQYEMRPMTKHQRVQEALQRGAKVVKRQQSNLVTK